MEQNELTFDMIGNMSEEQIEQFAEKEVIEDEELFVATDDDENPEGVDDDSQEEEENDDIVRDDDSSPNLYASIATSLKTDGVLNLLDDSDFIDIKDADDLAGLFQKQMDSMLDAQSKRINEAINNDVPIDTVKQYENLLSYLSSIQEETIEEETPESEKLRKDIIFQDYINRGFSEERALKEVTKSFNSGTDVEDALDSLKEVTHFYTQKYNEIIGQAKEDKQKKLEQDKLQSQAIEDKFMKIEEPIKGVKLSENERKKLLNQYTKFVDKDSNNNPLNVIQKYAKENPVDYQYNVNLLYYLTDGFKDIGKIITKEVRKSTKSALSNLESQLKNQKIGLGVGGLDFGNDSSDDSYIGVTVDFS